MFVSTVTELASVMAYPPEPEAQRWLVDSGATVHITNNADYLFDVQMTTRDSVLVGNGHECKAKCFGKAKLKGVNGGLLFLDKVLYIPGFTKNIISLGRLTSKGNTMTASGSKMTLRQGG